MLHVYDIAQQPVDEQSAADWSMAWSALAAITNYDVLPMSKEEVLEYFRASESPSGSAGFPYTCASKGEALTPEEFELWWDWHQKLVSGEKVDDVYFTLGLKRELLKPEKIAARATRHILNAPLYLHLSCIAIFGRFAEAFYADTDSYSQVGKTMYYGGWDRMLKRCSQFARNGIGCGDVQGCDVSQQELTFQHYRNFFKARSDSSQHVAIDRIFDLAQHSLIITSDGVVYQKCGSNPTGWFLTIIVNTLCVVSLLLAWYRRQCISSGILLPSHTVTEFVDEALCNFASINIGDDWACSCAHASIDVRTQTAYFATLNFRAHEVSVVHRPEEVSFCGASRSVILNGHYLRIPRLDKMMCRLQYSEKTTPALVWEKACGILLVVWPSKPHRDFVNSFLDYLKRRFGGAVNLNSRLSNQSIYRLYTGVECVDERLASDQVGLLERWAHEY